MNGPALLDVNVLVALLDADHVHHRLAGEWLDAHFRSGWASCPITENGLVRILSQPRYPGSVPVAHATHLLAVACEEPEHEFWPCDISTLDETIFDRHRLHGPRQITDAYLLALAVRHGGSFVTLDEGVPLSAVRDAEPWHLEVL